MGYLRRVLGVTLRDRVQVWNP